MTTRPPYVAGQFYPAQKEKLLRFLTGFLDVQTPKIHAKAIMVPHAGYVYSGATAAKTYARIEIPRTVLLIGPNHTGLGQPFALMARGVWQTPLGQVPIHEELASCLVSCPLLEADEEAHQYEHALEVQLPFLQYLRPDVRIVPLTVGTHELGQLKEAGHAVGKVLAQFGEPVLIVISSDMNHYEDEDTTQKKDQTALSALLKLDGAEFASAIKKHGISMCGFAPAYMALSAFKFLDVKRAEVVEHTTSAKVSGDYDRVVGYAGVLFE